MTAQENHKLGKLIWKIATDHLWGAMPASSYQDYLLSLLFMRYLSDNYELVAKDELKDEYPVPPEGPEKTPLRLLYDENQNQMADFESMMRRRIHYVLKPEFLWSEIVERARTMSPNLLDTLDRGFRFVENESFDSAFQGLFSEINLHSEKLGRTPKERNDRLCKIIQKLDEGLADFSIKRDDLGDAYEYLIGLFAAGSGKKAGEFYTPQHVSNILSAIATLDSHDPKGGPRDLENVLDFACGSGSLLLNLRHRVVQSKKRIGKIWGQEKNVTTYNLARMNMLLHGVRDSEFEIFHGDTLLNEWDALREMNPAKKPKFDAIVANPPFSYRWEASSEWSDDMRFNGYGVAPKSAADFAFLLHGLHYLDQQGVMAIILPHGVLFRGGVEQRIREKLLKDGHIDTIIGLPANLFFSTGIPVCILVLKKCKQFDDVLFINAAGEGNFEKVKKQNILREDHVARIVDTYVQRPAEVERYARRVGMAEIEENGYNLNISRYVSTAHPEKEIDLRTNFEKLAQLEKEIEDAKARHNEFLKELGLPLLP